MSTGHSQDSTQENDEQDSEFGDDYIPPVYLHVDGQDEKYVLFPDPGDSPSIGIVISDNTNLFHASLRELSDIIMAHVPVLPDVELYFPSIDLRFGAHSRHLECYSLAQLYEYYSATGSEEQFAIVLRPVGQCFAERCAYLASLVGEPLQLSESGRSASGSGQGTARDPITLESTDDDENESLGADSKEEYDVVTKRLRV